MLLEGFFLIFTSDSVLQSNQIRLPFGEGKTSPVAVEDVARVFAVLLADPQPHIGKIYHLTGPQSEDMHFYAKEYSKALGRTIIFFFAVFCFAAAFFVDLPAILFTPGLRRLRRAAYVTPSAGRAKRCWG